MRNHQCLALCMGIFVCLTLAQNAAAQGTSGIAGVVKDTSGAVLPGVTVEVTSPALIEKVRSAASDGQGNYKILSLPPGRYTITFTLTGFSTLKREGVELNSNSTSTANAELKVGSLEETVTVAGRSSAVDVQNAAAPRVISRQLLDSLPMNKEVDGFASITVGAIESSPSAQNVGGNKDPILAFISIHGSRARDGRQLVDGMNVNGEGVGRGFYFNAAAAEEVAIGIGSGQAEGELGGVQSNLIPKEGGNAFSGSFFANYSGKGLVGSNLTDELRARGLRSVNSSNWLYDVNGAIGGPIRRDKLWFFVHSRFFGFQTPVAGNYYNLTPGTLTYTPDLSRQAVTEQINHDHGARLTWQATSRNKFNFSYDTQVNCLCHYGNVGQPALFSPETSPQTIYGRPMTLAQAKWTFPISSRLLFEAGGAAILFTYPTNVGPPESVGGIRITDSARGYSWGAPTAFGPGDKTANQTNERVSVSYVTGTHAVKAGFVLEMGWHDHEFDYSGIGGKNGLPALPIDYGFFNGVPRSVTEYSLPLSLIERLKANLGLFVQDQWTVRRLTLTYGLRFDYFNAFVPARNLPAGPFVGARQFAEVDCVPCWKDIEPRLGGAWDLFGNGKTAIKANIGRYAEADRYYTVRDNNPAQTSVNAVTRTWNDNSFPAGDARNGNFVPDCNLALSAANGECGQFQNLNFGKANPAAATFASALLQGWDVRPYSWQSSLSIEHQVRPGVAVNAGYYRTWYGNWRTTENVAVTPADYTAYTFVAPVDPRLPGGGGYPITGFYDISAAKLGVTTLATSPSSTYGTQSEVYNGFDFGLNARLPHGQVGGGMNIGRQIFNNCDVQLGRPQVSLAANTAQVFFAPGRTAWPLSEATCSGWRPWDKQVKISGFYDLPWGLRGSATYQNLPGIPIFATMTATSAQIAPYLGRNLATGALGTAQLELLQPYTLFADRITQLDVRVSKVFRVARKRVETMLDIYNALNGSAILSENTTYGASWRTPTEVLGARVFKFGVQVDF